jgi:enoyl-CoA hydratase
MDMILTGRPVDAAEALSWGLANRVVPRGEARKAAESLAADLARFPQRCLRSDRTSAQEQWTLPIDAAIARELELGMETIASGETVEGASRFAGGAGRHGGFER